MSEVIRDWQAYEAVPAMPALPRTAHKGIAGRVQCICGSPEMPGAAQLVVRAAARGGAGLVTLVAMQTELIPRVCAVSPETIYVDCSRTKDLYVGRLPREISGVLCHSRVVGPGLSPSGRTRELVRRLIEDTFAGPLVLDADALNVIAGAPELLALSPSQVVITPHPGEAGRLLEREVAHDKEARISAAVELARLADAICVLKGADTVVTDGERVFVNPSGNPAMATAGAGDVLAGLLGAYLAWSTQCGDSTFGVFEATVRAVYVHGLAGDLAAAQLGQRATIASDLIEYLGAAQRQADAG
ncbi:MAG: NAD(P)H-hydrate dehydratase [Planctomycetota bacterium]